MSDFQEKIKELQEKSTKIIEGAIQVNTKIEAAQENLEKIKQISREKFGTDNLEELNKMLKDWEVENQNKYLEYKESVESLEKELNEKNALIKQIQSSSL